MTVVAKQPDATEFAVVLEHLEREGWAQLTAPPEIHRALRILVDAAQWFFDRPIEEKLKLDIRQSCGHRGYVPTTEQGMYADEGARRYEAFDIGRTARPDDLGAHRLRGENRWPDNPWFADAAEAGFEAMERFATSVGRAMCRYLDIEPIEFDRLRREPVSQLRLIRYLEPPVIELRDGLPPAMGAHTDYEFFTLLYQVGPGTQLLDRQGVWCEPPPAPDSLLLFGGDLLEVFSGGRFVSTMHRASGTVTPGRMTIPFFCGADFDAVVRPQTGADSGPVCFGDHLMRQLIRDFPYLRKIASETGELVVDLTDGDPAQHLSTFEQRRLAENSSPADASDSVLDLTHDRAEVDVLVDLTDGAVGHDALVEPFAGRESPGTVHG